MTLTDTIKAARQVSTPLVAITTPDYAQVIDTICRAASDAPALKWDRVSGMTALNEDGRAALLAALPEQAKGFNADELAQYTAPVKNALSVAARLPQETILILLGVHRLTEDETFEQAVWNLRDAYKNSARTLIMLAPVLTLPPGLASDVMVLDEALPTDGELTNMLADLHTDAGVPFDPQSEAAQKAVHALRGLAMFPAEQAAAMSLKKDGLDIATLWERKRKTVEQTAGIRFLRGGDTFDGLGGLTRVKDLGRRLFEGNVPPRVIVFIDEIEKMLGGAHNGGDTAGIQQDQLGVMLRGFDELEATGMIAVGPPGSGKSAFAKCLGASFDVPTLVIDLGAAKGSLVGQSEAMIRQVFKVISSVAGPRGAFFVATCNRLESIAPELKRRFRFGTWFFDLPDAQEREAIWKISLKKQGLFEGAKRPNDADWTGADIAACCDLAYRMNCDLREAAGFLVPVAQSDPASIQRIRQVADGTFASASHAGVYRMPDNDRTVPVASEGQAKRRFTFQGEQNSEKN